MTKDGAQEYIVIIKGALDPSKTVGTAQQKWLVTTDMMGLILILPGKAHAIMHLAFSGILLPTL